MTGNGTRAIRYSFPRTLRDIRRILRVCGISLMWLSLLVLNIWAIAALYIDCRISWLRVPVVLLYAAIVTAFLWRTPKRRALCCLLSFVVVLAWWLSLRPSEAGNWRADVAQRAWAETAQNYVTIHNVRNCAYRSETEYTNCWEDRTYDLSHLRGADFFFVNWGVPWIGHPIVSFDFGPNQHVAFSIEARYKAGQTYSAALGFFRQYELIFIPADERDVIRLRTNYRKDEEVYLYRTTVSPDIARKLFLTYVDYLNQLRDHPEWYNAVTKNCTTTLSGQFRSDMPTHKSWNYRFLVNGTLDELLYQRGRLVTDGFSFADLKQREHINAYAHTVDDSPSFAALIREGRVGF
jgi:hypothetical protein